MESNHGQSFLGNDASEYDDFAALDSMGYTGTQPSGAASMGSGGSAVGDGRENGFPGVSGSLFDRIRARTAEEQQKKQKQQQQQSSSSLPPPSQEALATSSGQSSQQMQMQMQQPQYMQQQQQQQPSAFVSQQQRQHQQHYGVVEPAATMDPAETTYSFATSGGGEDFSPPLPPRVPTYGASRGSDPHNYAAVGGGQPAPSSSALARTGEAARAVLGAGLGAARAIGALARDKIGGGAGGAGAGGGGRSYNNNFLLREDSMEGGGSGGGYASSGPPPAAATAGAGPSSEAAIGASGQAYSMLKYGKTFCEDLFLFFADLPTWGKVLVGLIVLWGLYVVFDS
jgi:hypothetical protein